jgi:hypothetical protein
MPYSKVEITEYSRRIGKSVPTLWRWIREGCNLRDPKSVRQWETRNEIRKTNIAKARERRGKEQKTSRQSAERRAAGAFASPGNGDLPAAGRKGAAAALQRLEESEEEAHRRLQAALVRGDPVQVAACQDFWLKCSETLRRLDLAIEVSRRAEETQLRFRCARLKKLLRRSQNGSGSLLRSS